MKQIALAIGRELATPAEARQMLGLPARLIATKTKNQVAQS